MLWTYSFADYSRRVRRTARHGQYLEGQADSLGRLTSLTTDLAGSAHDNVTSFAYNSASQIGSRTISNDAYAWTGHAEVDRLYAANGLNQYTTAGPATFGYDANGNLTTDGLSAYVYDIENRLVSASGATNAQLRYDPLGRLHETSGGAAGITRFLYDGDELVAEYNSSGTLLRRYVHGAATDDPLVWYEGADYADPRWMMADHQGSIVGISKASTTLGLNSYDTWGIPNAANQGRFQYTGQAWIPELGMYHYKARIYSPTLGRFLQTDPVGYNDQINLYAYVGNDPLNNTDSSGMCARRASGCGEADPYFGEIIGTSVDGTRISEQPPPGPRTATSTAAEAGGTDDDQSIILGDHDYPAGPNEICPASWGCTPEIVGSVYSAIRNAIPGNENASGQVVSGREYTVYAAGVPLGRVTSHVGRDRLTVANVTTRVHILHFGWANRNAYRDRRGNWQSITHGRGTNYYGGAFMAGANEIVGPGIFNSMDQRIRAELYRLTH